MTCLALVCGVVWLVSVVVLCGVGFYLIVFDMEKLGPRGSTTDRAEALGYLRFWLNSIAIHTRKVASAEAAVAPIALVGSRKDMSVPHNTLRTQNSELRTQNSELTHHNNHQQQHDPPDQLNRPHMISHMTPSPYVIAPCLLLMCPQSDKLQGPHGHLTASV